MGLIPGQISMSLRATKPVGHNYWTCALEPRAETTEPMCHSDWSLSALELVLCSKRSHLNEQPAHKKENFKWWGRDFPGGAVDKNPPAKAGDTGSTPGPGRFNMPWMHLGPWATTTEPGSIICVPQKERPPQWEARAPQRRVAPLAATRENSCKGTKTQHSHK